MRSLRVFFGPMVLLLTGCGGNSASVSGVVTLDGNPVEGASVTFTPETGGGGSYGRTDAQGRYSLKTVVGDKNGATVGKNKVSISLNKSDTQHADGPVKEVIPAKYNANSELTFDVPSGGTSQANFDLQK